ncbi:MAG: hypothetical protein U0835_13280 [Isosphaeraceae bacterium]
MTTARAWVFGFAAVIGCTLGPAEARAAEVRLDRGFVSGLLEKLPPAPFAKEGQYHGEARGFRLAGIDPKKRRLLVACEVAGEFRPPIAAAIRKGQKDGGWQAFKFDVTVGIRAEPGRDGAPKVAVDVEEVRRRELDGVAGLLAKVLGRHFDEIVTQVADGKVNDLTKKINAQVVKRIEGFKQYGVLREVGYTSEEVILVFDVTKMRPEGVVGLVYAAPAPGTVPLHRWTRPRRGDHFYTTSPDSGSLPALGYVYEGVCCHVPAGPGPNTLPLSRWKGPHEWFYTTDPKGEGALRLGYRPETVACHVLSPEAKPAPEGTTPLYRFVDPRKGVHFYTTHPHAEFLK